MFSNDQNKGVSELKIFVAGPRAIKDLDKSIAIKLENICKKEYEVLVGDADGIDSSVQKFLNKQNYKNVTVYASKGIARNNYGNWRIKNVTVNENVTGFEFYAKKDFEMAKNSDIGFMIWNGTSRGTFNNMINLLKLGKNVILYYTPNQKFYQIKNINELEKFLSTNVNLNNKLKKMLPPQETKQFVQVCLF